jgi:hypothetical protein
MKLKVRVIRNRRDGEIRGGEKTEEEAARGRARNMERGEINKECEKEQPGKMKVYDTDNARNPTRWSWRQGGRE